MFITSVSPLSDSGLSPLALLSRKTALLIVSWLLSSFVAYVLASVFHSNSVLVRLSALGISIPMQERLSMTMYDLKGLVAYFFVIAIGYFIAFLVFAGLTRWQPTSSWLFYGVAGVLAVAAILTSMSTLFSMTPIAGARGTVGFALQLFAGGVGGALFGWCVEKSSSSARS